MADKKDQKSFLSPADAGLAVLFLAVAGICVFQLNRPASFGESGSFTLATVEAPINNVRAKAQGELAWAPAREGHRLANEAQVFTGEEAGVNLQLARGGELSLGRNTLVKIKAGEALWKWDRVPSPRNWPQARACVSKWVASGSRSKAKDKGPAFKLRPKRKVLRKLKRWKVKSK